MADSKMQSLTRRGFLAGTAALAGASMVLSGCQEQALTAVPDDQKNATDLENGTWVTAGCWQTCHCGCINKAYVVDGIVVRQKTDDSHPDSPDYPQQRSCVKGHSIRQLVLGADRLKYPMKRKNWEPGGKGDNTLRGRDEWERISWDEALDYVSSEFLRIQETYGNLSFATPSLAPVFLMCAFGGYTTIWGQQSQGGWPLVGNTIKGSYGDGNNDRFSMRESDLIVLWGFNSIYSAGGSNTAFIRHAKDEGAKVIMVDSWFSPTAQGLGDEWVPVRPGTDGALLAAVAYHLIENNLQDQEFLDTYCVGFDSEHMPEGEEGQESFKDYILGTSDNTPKTPEWAASICGTAPSVIRNLAEQMASAKAMTLKAGQAPGRTHNGAEFAQMFYTVGWMTGNIGKPGSEVAAADGSSGVQGGDALVALGEGTSVWLDNIGCTLPRGDWGLEYGDYDPEQYYGIAYAEFWDAIITGKHTDFTRGERECNIKCLFKLGPSGQFNQNVAQTRAIEALRAPGKVEFSVVSDFVMSPDCQFADIVLPAATPWEREGGYVESLNRETLIYASKVIEPYFEAKSDWWMYLELADRLGIDTEILAPEDPEIDTHMMIAEAQVICEDGETLENLAAVTAEDIEELGLPMEPQEGRVPLKEIAAQGGYQVERSANDNFGYVALSAFREDPVANPLDTASGKLEIFSRTLVDRYANYRTTDIAPIAKYVPAQEGYEASFSDFSAQQKGDYPFQVIGIHVARQAHSSFTNVKQLNEIFANDLMLNTRDAEALGLESGDTALLTAASGKTLRRVQVTNRVMPGVVIVGQGNWTELDEETGIDVGCNMNTLTPGTLVGAGHCAFNSVLVNIEKWLGTALEPDYTRPQVIPHV